MAAQSPGGTSYSVFGDFPVPMAGKTGTAERAPNADQSWYVALAPYPNPQIVVAATIKQPLFGVEAAAPVTKHILESYFNVHERKAKAAGGKVPGGARSRLRPLAPPPWGTSINPATDVYPRPFDERRDAGAAERGSVWASTRCSCSPPSGWSVSASSRWAR